MEVVSNLDSGPCFVGNKTRSAQGGLERVLNLSLKLILTRNLAFFADKLANISVINQSSFGLSLTLRCLTDFAGEPTLMDMAGRFLVTVEPEAITAPDSMVTPSSTATWEPSQMSSFNSTPPLPTWS